MCIGIDVFHDVKQKNPSVAAIVASMNNQCTRHVSRVIMQRVCQEYCDSLRPVLKDLFDSYISVYS